MKPKFKVGDKVECIVPAGDLVCGNVYTVNKNDGVYVYIGYPPKSSNGYYIERFKLVSQQNLPVDKFNYLELD